MLKQGYRTPPKKAPQPSFTPPNGFTVQLKTITPMFGGSATTREVDPLWPVRAASIRGHLRFWWRATAGAQYDSAKGLFDAESEIWGNTENPGQVRIEVTHQTASKATVPSLSRELKYVTFPFQEQQGVKAAKAIDVVEFTLRLQLPKELEAEVVNALHAWVMFGGIGARTRRGCGSLAFVDGKNKKPQPPTQSPQLLTVLPSVYYISQRSYSSATDAWKAAVKLYSDFRQGDGIARVSSKERSSTTGRRPTPGRSFWPEPDSLRRATGDSSPKHKPRNPEFDGFPRADLGLPIGFQFKDEKAGDPKKLTLQGATEKFERFASPVITKAVCISGKFYAMIAILDSPHVYESPYGVTLVTTQGRRKVIPRIDAKKLRLVQPEPPQNNLPIRQALVAFALNQSKDQGFKEVKL